MTPVFLLLPLLAVFAAGHRCESQEVKQNWRKRFKQARYVVFSWEGSISRYQLSLLQDTLTGELVDDMINRREEAHNALADLQGCPPEYGRALLLLKQISHLLGKQESLCTGKEYIMAHLEEWRSNKKAIKRLHQELNRLLKL